MSAQALEVGLDESPDWQAIEDWAAGLDLAPQQVDCLISLMLKILDGKCQMDADSQASLRIVYRQAHNQSSQLFDPAIHDFIERVTWQPDLVSLRHVHELRLYAESAIARPVMKRFKQFLWAEMPGF